jgi:hypothetical protein
MKRALAYGLMGAASGFLGGLYDEARQSQADQRSARLAQAEMLEKQQLMRMQAQFNSAENLQKVQLQLQADMTRDQANNQAKSDLQSQQAAAKAQEDAINNAADEKRAQISAGATVQAAKIHAASAANPHALSDAMYVDKAGHFTLVKSGDTPPPGSRLVVTAGGSVGPYQRQTVVPPSLFGSPGAQPTVQNPGDAQTSSADDNSGSAPGSSFANPIDAQTLTGAPPIGTWVRTPDGSVKQYLGGKPNGG